MRPKQICKVSYDVRNYRDETVRSFQGYGVCINDHCFLLEDGKYLICNEGKRPVEYNSLFTFNAYNGSENVRLTESPCFTGVCIAELSIGATKNVPASIRTSMEEAGEATIKMIKMEQKFSEMRTEYVKQMKEQKNYIENMPAVVRGERHELSLNEFRDKFYEALSEDVKYAMRNATQRGYNGMCGEYEVEINSDSIQISRDVWIEKYATPSFTYLEYDDTRCFISGAEKTEEYQSYIKNYSRPLPVKAEMKSYLSLEDKNSLECHNFYVIPLDHKKRLTEDYAKSLADKFCGVTREREEKEDLEAGER